MSLVLFLLIFLDSICRNEEFNCGGGFCIQSNGECDGFNDCLNNADETFCGTCNIKWLNSVEKVKFFNQI